MHARKPTMPQALLLQQQHIRSMLETQHTQRP